MRSQVLYRAAQGHTNPLFLSTLQGKETSTAQHSTAHDSAGSAAATVPAPRLSLVNSNVITLTERTVQTIFIDCNKSASRHQLGHQSTFASEMKAPKRGRQALQVQQVAEMHARLAIITVDAMCRDIDMCTDMCTDTCTDNLHRHSGCAGLVKQVSQSRCVICFRVGASQLMLCEVSGCAVLMKQVRQSRYQICTRDEAGETEQVSDVHS